jgi:hypothetical protein
MSINAAMTKQANMLTLAKRQAFASAMFAA